MGLLARPLDSVMVVQSVIRGDGDASRAPACVDFARLIRVAVGLSILRLWVGDIVRSQWNVFDDLVDEPAISHVICVDDAARSQLDSLPRPVHPGKVDVEGGLDDAEDDRDGIRLVGAEETIDPVEDVKGAIRTESDEVERVDDGGDGGLTEENELRQDTECLEDDGESPKNLGKGEMVPTFKDQGDEGCRDDGCCRDIASPFPSLFPFSCTGINSGHEKDDVDGGPDVEVFQNEIPP